MRTGSEKECNWCGGTHHVIRVSDIGQRLCEFCREIRVHEKKLDYGKAYSAMIGGTGRKRARTRMITENYLHWLKRAGAEEFEPECSTSGCGSKRNVLAITTRRGISLLCEKCRDRLYSRKDHRRKYSMH